VINAVHRIKPDVVTVSGDLTQRARPQEFTQAREFLDALPKPQIVVPGNHDVPMHNVYARFSQALTAYRNYVVDDLEPFYRDDEVAILGINTTRSLTIKGGRINEKQIARVEERFCDLSGDIFKVLVTHHPFDLPEHYGEPMLVGRAAKAMARFARCGIDVLLAGHLHVSHSGPTALRYSDDGYSSIFVQAGTACSTRGRGEPNSFNVIRLARASIEIETLSTEGSKPFERASAQRFVRSASGWKQAK
jgi:3',5'-cyclic AMP phosphodiesterase CpdA